MGQIQINNRPYSVHQPMKNVKGLLTADQFHLIPLFRFLFFMVSKEKNGDKMCFKTATLSYILINCFNKFVPKIRRVKNVYFTGPHQKNSNMKIKINRASNYTKRLETICTPCV